MFRSGGWNLFLFFSHFAGSSNPVAIPYRYTRRYTHIQRGWKKNLFRFVPVEILFRVLRVGVCVWVGGERGNNKQRTLQTRYTFSRFYFIFISHSIYYALPCSGTTQKRCKSNPQKRRAGRTQQKQTHLVQRQHGVQQQRLFGTAVRVVLNATNDILTIKIIIIITR